jgi:hypothetical protein
MQNHSSNPAIQKSLIPEIAQPSSNRLIPEIAQPSSNRLIPEIAQAIK